MGRRDDRLVSEIEHYGRKIKPFARLTVEYLRPPGGRRDGAAQSLAREAAVFSRRLDASAPYFALAEEGELCDSRQFATLLGKSLERNKTITFVIGGAYGLAQSIKRDSVRCVSLSRLTFPHRVCVLLVAEQVYRAFTILRGLAYHK